MRGSIPTARAPIRIDYGTRTVDDAAALAKHLKRAGFNVEVADAPSTDAHLLSATAAVTNIIETWLPAVEQGLLANFVWWIGAWGIRKAKEMLKKGDGSYLQIRVNPDKPNEMVVSVSNTGAWKYEKLPTNPRALLPPPPTPHPPKRQKRKGRKK